MPKKELINNTTAKPLLTPTITPLSAGTSSTLWLSRADFMSAIVALAVGAASGTPTSYSVKATIQDADDASGTGAANLEDINGDDIEIELTADDTNINANIDLIPSREFIGASVVVAFVDGTTPAVPVNATIVLGDPNDTREADL